MMDASAEVILKIKKLLELASAERNPSQHEAELAMAKVHELLAKHELDMAAVEQSAEARADEFIIEPHGEPVERWHPRMRFALAIVQEYFHVKALTSSGFTRDGRYMRKVFENPGGGQRICFLGRKTNVAIAEHVYGFLYAEFERQWRRHRIETGAEPSARTGFYEGLYFGLRARLDQERREPAPESAAIVRRSEEAALGEYLRSVFPGKGKSSRYGGTTDLSSYADGRTAGQQLNIRPAVNQASGRRSLPPGK